MEMEQTFGQRLKNYRKAKGLTQQELAEKIGVSDKTVSRWESDGGYPDVPTLAPLARALGVTVDDLLNTQRPIRTLTQTDWQSLLSFAFALGGGVGFFLLKLFVPAFLCYLAYLGCLAYGVYLQKYYAYQSRWFLLGEAVVNLGVNLSIVWGWLSLLAGVTVTLNIYNQHQWWRQLLLWCLEHFVLMGILGLAAALVITAVTQYLVWKKGFDGAPVWEVSQGHGATGHAFVKGRLRWRRPGLRKALPALVPLLAGCYWLPALWESRTLESFRQQDKGFLYWLLLLGVLAALPLLKRGRRRWILPAWLMTWACTGMLGLKVYPTMWSPVTRRAISYSEVAVRAGNGYFAIGWGSWGTVVCALGLAAVWLALCGLTWEAVEPEPEEPSQEPYGA